MPPIPYRSRAAIPEHAQVARMSQRVRPEVAAPITGSAKAGSAFKLAGCSRISRTLFASASLLRAEPRVWLEASHSASEGWPVSLWPACQVETDRAGQDRCCRHRRRNKPVPRVGDPDEKARRSAAAWQGREGRPAAPREFPRLEEAFGIAFNENELTAPAVDAKEIDRHETSELHEAPARVVRHYVDPVRHYHRMKSV